MHYYLLQECIDFNTDGRYTVWQLFGQGKQFDELLIKIGLSKGESYKIENKSHMALLLDHGI